MPASVVVHDLAQALASARAASATGAPLTLRSAHGVGRSLGVGGWMALAAATRAAAPEARLTFCIDCADHVGDAHAAIAAGARRLALEGDGPGARRIARLAAAEGAELDREPADLDLAFIHDPEAAVARLLQSSA